MLFAVSCTKKTDSKDKTVVSFNDPMYPDEKGITATVRDGISDVFQAFVEFRSADDALGTVTGELFQSFTFTDEDGNLETEGNIKPLLDNVTVIPMPGYALDYWTVDSKTDKLSTGDVQSEHQNISGGTTIVFTAHFDKDNWKDGITGDDSETGGDGITDSRQALVKFVTSNNGTVSGSGALQVFTLSSETEQITPLDSGINVTAESGYAFDFWSRQDQYIKCEPFTEQTVNGGDTILYTAIFDIEDNVYNAVDNWRDDPNGQDSLTGGDGIADCRQICVEYRSFDKTMGDVSNSVEIHTYPNDRTVKSLTANGSTATPQDEHVFTIWDCVTQHQIEYESDARIITPVIQNVDTGDQIVFYAMFNSKDFVTLDNAITREYSFEKLENYFSKSRTKGLLSQKAISRTFNDVQQEFPVEVLRVVMSGVNNGNRYYSGCYTVYKVKEGGYYYAFFDPDFSKPLYDLKDNSQLIHSMYINKELDVSAFESIEIGKSTMSELMKIDPYYATYLLIGNFDLTYSLLNKNEIMEIEYDVVSNGAHYTSYTADNFIVKEKTVRTIDRDRKVSILEWILPEDFPN